jgi:hypothetical protein
MGALYRMSNSSQMRSIGGAVGVLLTALLIPPAASSEKAVIAVLAPVCADKFRALADVSGRTAILVANKDNSYKMREAFPEAFITLPGKSYPDSDLTAACAGLVLAPPKTANLQQ